MQQIEANSKSKENQAMAPDKTKPKDGKLLYHLTALENLESIFRVGLLARKYLSDFTDIADGEIIENREKYDLDSYVPFHFFHSTPFAGLVQKTHTDKEFVYLTLQRSLAKENNFKIFPCHPLTYKNIPLNYDEGIKRIDWELINLRDYLNHDCKEACLAECITDKKISVDHLHCIYVKSDATKEAVKNLYTRVKSSHLPFHVDVAPYMFVKHDRV